jgi:very-short-patch-repair endonuclease
MDSELHDEEHDKKRDEFMKTQGIMTIRIPNVDYLALKGSPSSDWQRHIQQTCEESTGRSAF